MKFPLLLMILYYPALLLAGDKQSTVLALLQGYEWSLQPEKFAGLDAATYKTLIDIAGDQQQVNFIRSRASVALTLYPNEAVWKFYSAEIADTQHQIQRRHQVVNLCASFSSVDPARVEQKIMPLLAEADPHLRVRTANCLRKIDSPSSRQALFKYRSSIASAWEAQAAGFGNIQ